MKSVKAVFKNGVFVPLEPCDAVEGCEAVVVYSEGAGESLPGWWSSVEASEEKKRAIKEFVERIRTRVFPQNVKFVSSPEGAEIFVIVDSSESALKPVMEEALKIYESLGVYLPVQVISTSRLDRWREQGSEIFKQSKGGVSLL